MSALAHQFPYSDQSQGRAPRLELVPPYQGPIRMAPVVFWRRRIAVLIVLATLAVGAWSLVTTGAGLISSQTSSPVKATTGLGGVSPAVQPSLSGTQWTVRPGDTLWSIARAVKPTGDIRTVLDPLIKQYAGEPLQIGQAITLPTFKD